MNVVETSGLTKRFGDRVAVNDVELRVPRGSAFGYLGPNGAGKTTLIRMLLGLTQATSGEMWLLGRPVPAERKEALSRVGAIVEEPRFHGHLTGRENLSVIAAAPRARGARPHRRGAGTRRPRSASGRACEALLARNAPAAWRRTQPAGRPGAADPGRAHERARSGRDPGVPPDDPRVRGRGPHRPALVAPAGRGGEDLRPGRDRRSGSRRRTGLDRRARRRRQADDPRRDEQRRASTPGSSASIERSSPWRPRTGTSGSPFTPTSRPTRRRETSAAASCSAAPRSTASSRVASRSSSGSWRSLRDWRKQHEPRDSSTPNS